VGRKRKADKHLPQKVYKKHGGYYYVSENKWTKIGDSLDEALRTYAKIIEPQDKRDRAVETIGQLLEAYMREVAIYKAQETYKVNTREAQTLKAVFESLKLEELQATYVAEYIERRKAPTRAKRELALLSHCYTWAIEKGWYTNTHPLKGVSKSPIAEAVQRKQATKKRPGNPPAESDLIVFMKAAGPMLRAAVAIGYICGLRVGDLLHTKRGAITEAGLLLVQSKSKRWDSEKPAQPRIYRWTPGLKAAVELAVSVRGSEYILSSRKPPYHYTDSGFQASWAKARARAREKGCAHITPHDLRRAAATRTRDIVLSKSEAQKLLGHSDPRTTEIYLYGVEEVTPAPSFLDNPEIIRSLLS
jgi:integrase